MAGPTIARPGSTERCGTVIPSAAHSPSTIFVIWAATQHYADFDVQVAALLGHSAVEAQDYAKATDTITSMVLAALGLEDPTGPR